MSRLPTNCPVCGEEMEKATLRAAGRGVEVWFEPRARAHGERIGGGLFQFRLVGFRCSNCKIFLCSYDKEEQKREND